MTTEASGATGGVGAATGGTGAAAAGGAVGAGGAATGGTGSGSATSWHGYTAPEDVAYVSNKGWQGPADVLKSYRDAERYIGRDPSTLLSLPRADDPAGFLATMDKLGRPAKPEDYKFDLPQGADPKNPFLEWARGTFHKLGLPAEMAKQLMKEQTAFFATQAEKTAADYKSTVALDKTALQNEWRGGFDRMMGQAKNAAHALGFTPEIVDGMEQEIGYAATMKFLANLGSKLGEDKFVSGGDKTSRFEGSMTPVEAKQAWDAMKLDPNLMAALLDKSHPGHKAASAKQTALFKIMHPEV